MPQVKRDHARQVNRPDLRDRPHRGSLASPTDPGQLRPDGDIIQCHRIDDVEDPNRPPPLAQARRMIDSAIIELAAASHTDEETIIEQIGVEAGVSPEIVRRARTEPLTNATARANIFVTVGRLLDEVYGIDVSADVTGPRLQT